MEYTISCMTKLRNSTNRKPVWLNRRFQKNLYIAFCTLNSRSLKTRPRPPRWAAHHCWLYSSRRFCSFHWVEISHMIRRTQSQCLANILWCRSPILRLLDMLLGSRGLQSGRLLLFLTLLLSFLHYLRSSILFSCLSWCLQHLFPPALSLFGLMKAAPN